MARITLPDGDNPEIVRALSLRPDFAQAVGGFEKAVWGSSLDWRLHELVRMQVAMINECTVCLGWRTPQAIEAGVTDELLAGVASYRTFPDFTEAERVALEYAEAVTYTDRQVDDALFAAVKKHFTEPQIVELTAAIAFENFRSKFNPTLGVEAQGFCLVPKRD
jgi:AhpD family alkylhydroperoxidase